MRTEEAASPGSSDKTLQMTTDIVASFVANNKITPEQLTDPEKQRPAVPVNKSIQDEFIVCLEDGKKLKMLKRYLRSTYNLSPDDYRKKWGLAPDYPMVAPSYAARRSEFAKRIGLGRGVRRKD
jgi:predicted transcriptional regulator